MTERHCRTRAKRNAPWANRAATFLLPPPSGRRVVKKDEVVRTQEEVGRDEKTTADAATLASVQPSSLPEARAEAPFKGNTIKVDVFEGVLRGEQDADSSLTL